MTPVHTLPVRVYWEDTDASGLVYHATYIRFMERGRTEWLRALGFNQQVLREQVGGMFVVSETAVKYHQPARLDDALWVTARVAEAGRVSLTIAQQVLLRSQHATSGQPDTLLAEGTIRIGWVDAASLKPARIPAAILESLK